jgi:hypothetical protein
MVRRVPRTALIALVAALALSGCVRVLADTTVHADDTYSQHLIVALNDEAATALAGQSGVNVADLLAEATGGDSFQDLEEQYPGAVEIADYVEGDLEGIEVTLDSLPIEQFNEASSSITGALGASATLDREGDSFVVTIASDPEQGLGDLDAAGGNLALLDSAIDFDIIYSFPGLVTEASAGTISGKSVRLSVSDLLENQDIRIVAGAEPAIDWAPIIRWVLIALAFAVIVGGATLLVMQDRRKRRRTHLPPPRPTTPE